MYDLKWSESEKKVARRVFDAAVAAELSEVMADFKARAAAASEPDDMWSTQEFLYRKRREIDEKYDYRYSQLLLVFGRLLREGRIHEAQLSDLAEEKLSYIRHIVSL
jgi:triphosphoribosyl-dephospho-CoA synthetase